MPPQDQPEAIAVDGTRFRVQWVSETGSTNDDVLAAARTGAAEGLVRVADHQTAGRGRLDRVWEAPPGSSLLVSVLLRPGPALPADRAHLCTKAVAMAAADAAQAMVVDPVGLKWPNDLVVDGPGGTRKLGGILAESVLDGDRLAAVVVGLGCNVAWPAALPPHLDGIATALNHLRAAPGRSPAAPDDRPALLDALLRGLEARWSTLLDDGGAALVAEYRDRCETIGTAVRVEREGRDDLEGQAVDVSPEGHLIVEAAGTVHSITVGDVVHLRRT